MGRTISICSSLLFEQLPDTEDAIHEEVSDAAQLLVVLQRVFTTAQDASVHVPYEQYRLQQWHRPDERMLGGSNGRPSNRR